MFIVRYKYNTTAYAANLDVRFQYTGPAATNTLADKIGMLGFGASGLDIVVLENRNLAVEILLTPNFPLTMLASAGNPTTGDGELFIYTRRAVVKKSGGQQVPTIIGQQLDKVPLARIK